MLESALGITELEAIKLILIFGGAFVGFMVGFVVCLLSD